MLISCCSVRQDWTPGFLSTSQHTDNAIPYKLLSILCWQCASIALHELLLQTQFTSLTQPEYKNISLCLVTEYTPICKSLNNLFYSSIPVLIVWMEYNTSLLTVIRHVMLPTPHTLQYLWHWARFLCVMWQYYTRGQFLRCGLLQMSQTSSHSIILCSSLLEGHIHSWYIGAKTERHADIRSEPHIHPYTTKLENRTKCIYFCYTLGT